MYPEGYKGSLGVQPLVQQCRVPTAPLPHDGLGLCSFWFPGGLPPFHRPTAAPSQHRCGKRLQARSSAQGHRSPESLSETLAWHFPPCVRCIEHVSCTYRVHRGGGVEQTVSPREPLQEMARHVHLRFLNRSGVLTGRRRTLEVGGAWRGGWPVHGVRLLPRRSPAAPSSRETRLRPGPICTPWRAGSRASGDQRARRGRELARRGRAAPLGTAARGLPSSLSPRRGGRPFPGPEARRAGGSQ